MYLEIEKIRRMNGQFLVNKAGGTGKAALILGKDQPEVSMLSGKNPNRPISSDMARFYEDKFGYQFGWMDHCHQIVKEHLASLKAIKKYKDPDNNLALYQSYESVHLVPLIDWSDVQSWINDDSQRKEVMADTSTNFISTLLSVSDKAYALKITGDLMMSGDRNSYPEGTIIIVDPEIAPSNHCRQILSESADVLPVFRDVIQEGDNSYSKLLNPIYQKADAELTGNFTSYGVVASVVRNEKGITL